MRKTLAAVARERGERGRFRPAAPTGEAVRRAPRRGHRSGDVSSFDDLFARQYEPMVRVAFLLLGSRAEAEEAVQDAFARVQLRWSRLDNAGGYLCRCVISRAYDLLRRRRLERRRIQPTRREPTSEIGADKMSDALALLSPRRRAAVVLRYYAELPEREIAEVLGVRPGTVKSMLHRALAQLREVSEP